jgi:sugar/nucleoside kinase (ribokinase family)
VDVCFYGPFGSDDVGAGALRFAVDNGVKVSPIASKESRKTIVVVDTDKTRSMVSDSADAFSLPYADSVPDLSSDVVHVSLSSIAKDESNSVLALLERSSLGFLSIDLGSVGVINRVSGGVLDRITNSAERVLIFANSDESRAARDRFGSVLKDVWCLVERSGPTGCYLTSGGESVYEPSLKDVSVIDTTGAGDAFAAGFLAAWMTGETDPNSVLKAAHAASADVISRVGTV